MSKSAPAQLSESVNRIPSCAMRRRLCVWASVIGALALVNVGAAADLPLERVIRAETERVELIRRIAPSAVCIYNSTHRSGGSGVLIDPEGYGLTNYHVVAGMLGPRKGWGGLADGVLYELRVLGVDVTGDVAMFRLLPPERWRDSTEEEEAEAGGLSHRDGPEVARPSYRFPFAKLGDSDKVQVGDMTIVVGNPFSLSEDDTPSVTQGMITGTHRYQKGSGGNLVYTDCLQTDASVNPGNSGGPLFNMAGEVIGINGRISVNTRGRFNVGFGYAISSNQIKRFIPALRAGLLARHGTWQARVTKADAGVVFSEIARSGPAYDAGLRVGHRLLSFDGVPITSVNQVTSMLGTYPANWPVLLEVGREGMTSAVLLRLDSVDPVLREPFKVDPVVNAQAIRRVLVGFRKAVLEEGSQLPQNRSWNVTRSSIPGSQDSPGPLELFEASIIEEGPALMTERLDDGTSVSVIEYDLQGARQRYAGDVEFMELPRKEAMVLSALFVLEHEMLQNPADMELTGVTHEGADLDLLSVNHKTAAASHLATGSPDANASEDGLLEIVRWPLFDDVVARYAFGSQTFAIKTITVDDALTGVQARIRLSNPCDLGGLVWPCIIRVEADGYAYEDTLSKWEPWP